MYLFINTMIYILICIESFTGCLINSFGFKKKNSNNKYSVYEVRFLSLAISRNGGFSDTRRKLVKKCDRLRYRCTFRQIRNFCCFKRESKSTTIFLIRFSLKKNLLTKN